MGVCETCIEIHVLAGRRTICFAPICAHIKIHASKETTGKEADAGCVFFLIHAGSWRVGCYAIKIHAP